MKQLIFLKIENNLIKQNNEIKKKIKAVMSLI